MKTGDVMSSGISKSNFASFCIALRQPFLQFFIWDDDFNHAISSNPQIYAQGDDGDSIQDHDDASSTRLDVGLRVPDAAADERTEEPHLLVNHSE